MTLRITDDRVDTLDDEAAADVTLTATVDDLAAALDPDQAARLVDQGRLTVDGRRQHVRQLAAPSSPPSRPGPRLGGFELVARRRRGRGVVGAARLAHGHDVLHAHARIDSWSARSERPSSVSS